LLKLRKIEMTGFKSFSDRTTLSLGGRGITCIVGPNGCGKSNIVDAITWVLGEQSHKSLRAERMADCISNGSASRAPLGMAEVSLTLVDPELAEAAEKILNRAAEPTVAPAEESAAPATAEPVETASAPVEVAAVPVTKDTPAAEPVSTDVATTESGAKAGKGRKRQTPVMKLNPGEVVITRRLYRSGQSEYLINGRQALLRDIQELFMGMGLGPNSYAIIEQGRIGQILSSRPAERRAILEEAAGVSKYKTKKRLAEAKLESSKVNLSRVNDILAEVTKQLGSLKRQAAKARRHAELREEMRTTLTAILAAKWDRMASDAQQLALQFDALREDESRETARLGELENEQRTLESRVYELEGELRENQNLRNQSALEADRTRNRVVYNRQQDQQIEFQIGQMERQAEELAGRAAAADERLKAQQETLDVLARQKADIEAAANALAERTEAAEARERALAARREELLAETRRMAEAISRAQVEAAEAGEARRHHAESCARAEDSLARLSETYREQTTALATAETRWNESLARAEAANNRLAHLETSLAERRRDQMNAVASLTESREQLAAARARKTSLDEILRERAYAAGTIQKLLGLNGDGEKHGFRTSGLLSDFAEVEPRYEAAVEQFLREELDFVVVESFDCARAGVNLLRSQLGGRATFFVDSLGSLPSQVEPESPIEREPGVVARMDRLVTFRQPLGEPAKRFLPRLRSAFLVENAAAAERMANAHPERHFVTTDGSWYHGRLVGGGMPGEAGPLALKRELRECETLTAQHESSLADCELRVTALEAEVADCATAVERARAEATSAEKLAASAAQEREHAQAENGRFAAELETLRASAEKFARERDTADERARGASARMEEATATRINLEQEAASTAAQAEQLRLDLNAERSNLATGRAGLAGITERLAAAQTAMQALQGERTELRERFESIRRDVEALAMRRTVLAADSATAERELEELARRTSELEASGNALDEEFRLARSRVLEIGETLRGARVTLDQARERRNQVEVERARLDSEIEHLRGACQSELGLAPDQIIAERQAAGVVTALSAEELAAAETSHAEMKARLDSLGPINMMALEEFKECENRSVFLTRERDDLVHSIADTEQAIAELDRASRERFEQAFTQINANFSQAFTALFGGGMAEMRLGEPDSSGESGLDIVAQPPGKRLQNVMLLSGGEKALTALALLIAIFRFQPSPFCVLDEVDAPLDEANVVRFNGMLREMSTQTQFLVVTHNRRTMETGSALYGVTMQEPGVSRIVSVRWEEAESDAA
jgi:chromosome segregation protein